MVGLEDSLLDLALVLKQGKAKCKNNFIPSECYTETETRIQQSANMEKDGINLISSTERLGLIINNYNVK